jgi:NAD(P)-dependent dehydrogenase (short-subunit alcohol dehydrogenase family)
MRRQRRGHLLHFSAIGGFVGYPGFGVYCAAKSATGIVGEALAAELAPFGIASTVLTIGIFETRFVGASLSYAARRIDAYADTPAGRFRRAIGGLRGRQANLADKGAAAIVHLMEADQPPLHAALGADAMGAMRGKMAAVERELAGWRDNAVSTARGAIAADRPPIDPHA